MSETTLIRIGILVAGIILFAAILWFGRPKKPGQGRRVDARGSRIAPTLGDEVRAELDVDDEQLVDADRQADLGLDAPIQGQDLGKRVDEDFDKIVSLFVAARAGQLLRGPDILVAAEKAGLTYGHMDVFHRLIDRKPEAMLKAAPAPAATGKH